MTSFPSTHDSLLDWVRRTENPRLIQIIQRHMDGLRRSVDGDELYGLIARILRRHSREGSTDAACFAELYHHLDAYAGDPVSTPGSRIKARLLQQHIAPYLPDDGRGATAGTSVDADVPSDAVEVPYQAVTHTGTELPREGTLHARLPAAPERRQRYEALQRSEQDAWRAIYDVVRDFSSLKKLWTESFDEMSAERRRLEQKLADTEQTLQSVEANARKLKSDLESAQKAPARKVARRAPRLLRGATPRLVTREAFLQQLHAEVSRVKRGGGSAALAMLDVAPLDAIARQHGAGAESAVLNCYAHEILSGFRAYDIVSRYDDTVFAVLLPDTGQDGAVRALEKAQKRAGETHVGHDGRRFPLPGFHGALTVYLAGEEPLAWLQRAERAIDEAQQRDDAGLVVV